MKEKRRWKGMENGADMTSKDDTLGSYTGVVSGDVYEKPVQDADDL